MLGEIIPLDDIISSGEISPPTEINWPPVAEDEEGSQIDYSSGDRGKKGRDISWFPGDVVEKGTELNCSSKAVQKAKGQVGGEQTNANQISGAQAFSPVGLKVLVVDDNRVCLAVLEKMLNRCKYTVTTCNSAAMALSLVQDKSTPFDLVLCDVHMPGMDGFKLLEALVPVRELPVIMMSSDDETDVVMKGITRGACDYFLKPVCLQRLRTIWQHVFRRREMIEAAKDNDCMDSDTGRGSKLLSDRDNSRKRKGKEEATDDQVEFVNGNKKKTRLVWTTTLHKQFVDAVKHLGTANAVPKQILEKMNVKGISRENVASHLQKYRKYLIDQETMYDDDKDSGGGMTGHSYQLEPFQPGGHFGGSIEIQSGAISSVPYNVPSLNSPIAMHSFHSPNALSSIMSPNTLSSLHSPNPMSSLHSASTLPSHHPSNTISSLHSPNTIPSHHPSNTLSSLHSSNTIPSHHSSNTLSSLHSPNTIPPLHSAHNITSLTSPNTLPSIHSVDALSSLHSPHTLSPLLSPNTVSSLQSPHRMNFPSRQTMPPFPSGRPVPSLHSHPTTPSFPSDRVVPSFHSSQSLSSDYSVNTELYPTPSQSFQAVETVNFRSGVTPDQSFDLASSSNFSNRIRQFPVDAYSPPLVTPAFYNTEY
ncbi:unnamed protein product [Calypogeia fissa]